MKNTMLYFVLLGLCSCGTITNLQRPVSIKPDYGTPEKYVEYYGGVGFDIDMLEENTALGVVDMPFSLIFDTVTLPVVFFRKSSQQFTEYEKETVPDYSTPQH